MLVFYRFTDIIEGNGLTRVAIVMLALAVSHGAMSGASPTPRKAVSTLTPSSSPGVSTTVRAAKNGRLVRTVVAGPTQPQNVGYLAAWSVDERWHNQKVGRWLLRRVINDATQRGLAEVVAHVHLNRAAALNLLGQHGFVELNYRGYSFGKALAA